MLPVAHRQVLARLSVSALAASLPLLYVSLLRPPPAALAGDTAFWFLMSNCVVAAIVAADDAGALLFGSSTKSDQSPCCHDDADISYVSEPEVAFVQDGRGEVAVPSTVASYDVPTAVDMGGARVRDQEELASVTASSDSTHHALPFLVRGDENPSSHSSTGLDHASALRRHGPGADEPIAGKNHNNIGLEGRGGGGGGGEERPFSASDAAIPGADEVAIVAEPQPGPGLVEEEDDIPEAWAIARQSRTPDLQQQGKGADEGKLRRSATEGSKPATAEDSEYWELSDEELNRRVEEFIARFNREMQRQIEQEAEAGV